jgi:predicted nucleic acid-binding protein
MIVVDTSVWIDHFNGRLTERVSLLRMIVGRHPILVGDLVLCEVLQGARNDHDALRLDAGLRQFDLAPMVNPDLAARAAGNYRRLRTRGVTVRKTIDVLIGTFCIENSHVLLHDDRDFQPMVRHLGLRVL